MLGGGFGLIFGLFALFAIGVIVIGVLGYRAAKQRQAELAALATARGWTYVESDDRWVDSFSGAPFGHGHRRSASNVLMGTHRDRPFVAFDYTYYTTETSTDSHGHTTSREVSHDYGVVGMDVGVEFPALEVDPEGFFSRMVGRLTNQDIELESEDFNRAFGVTCPDRKFASDILHPALMEFLLKHPKTPFRFDRRYLLTIGPGASDAGEIDQALSYLATVVDQVPEFVWRAAEGR